MTGATRPAIMVDLLEDHFDELDWLWEHRERSVFDADYTLSSLLELERRAWAHLEGLKLGGDRTFVLVEPHLTGDDTSAATAATYALDALGRPDVPEIVLAAFADGCDDRRDGIRIALHHLDPGRYRESMNDLTGADDPQVAVAAMEVLAFHGDPISPVPENWLHHDDERLRLLAIRVVGRVAQGPFGRDVVAAALATENPKLRRAVLDTAARVGMPDVAGLCRQAATASAAPIPEAMAFLGVVGDPDDLPLLTRSLTDPLLGPPAAEALGALGLPESIESLIGVMHRPQLAHAAGAAFLRITGADEIDANEPLPPPEGMSEEEVDFLDSSLPPDPERARAWWKAEGERFENGGHWQAGFDVADDPLGQAFDRLPLSCRRDLYLRTRADDPSRIPPMELERRANLQLRDGAGSGD